VRFYVVSARFCVQVLVIGAFLALSSRPSQAADPKAMAGAVLFRDRGCAYCHGQAGEGTVRGPSLADVRKKLKPEEMAHQIETGGKNMPPFRQALSDDEVSQLVSFLRAKHRPVAPPAPVSVPLSNPVQ
jgi:mono/diheme cytochrome c family protein